MNTLNKKILDELLTYCPETGNLYWKKSKKNTVIKAGDVAGRIDKNGYRRLCIDYVRIDCHRAIWIMVYGSIPEGMVIDHIDHDRSNNRLDNLRLTTVKGNGRNLKMNIKNKSGVTGVRWEESRNKWVSYIRVDGKTKFLGRFDLLEDAIMARKIANEEHNFHENHGITR